MPTLRTRLSAAALLAATAVAGCGGDGPTPPPPPPPALQLSAAGPAERGLELTLTATSGGQPVAVGDVSWTYTPASAVQIVAPGRIRLLAAGALQVQGTRQGSTATLNVTVQPPPVVVFDMVVDGNRDIYRVALDGADLQRLTTTASDDRSPTVGGGRVVFVSYRSGNAELYSMPLAGGEATRLSTTAQAESSPALSPNGQRLAYAFELNGVAKVYVASGTNQGRTQAAPGYGFAGSPEVSPAWHPTENRIAFVGTAAGSGDVVQVTPGGTPAMVAGGPRADVDPAWSPDGTRIAFASNRDAAGEGAIYLATVATGAVTQLSNRANAEAEPAWTADGRLVYVEFSPGDVQRLVWIDPATPAAVHPIPVAGGSPRRPSVAP